MTVKETAALMGILQEAYPKFYADKSDDEILNTAELWSEFLSDTDLKTAVIALKRLIATCKFPPTIAEMRESISAVGYKQIADAGEAWREVNEAISYYGFYREAEALASMREPTRQTVVRMGWRSLCMSDVHNDMADRAHFIRIYDLIAKRMEEERLLPVSLREDIAMIGKMPEPAGLSYSSGYKL